MRNNKKSILIFVSHYLPAYKGGGPIQSISNLVDKLNNDYFFNIVTRDRDLGDLHPFPNLKTDNWNQLHNCRVYYSSPKNKFIKTLSIIKSHGWQILYLNSLFDWNSSILPLMLCKFFSRNKLIIVAPRGELDPGALAISNLKKRGFLFVSKLLKLHTNIRIHVTSAEEKIHVINALKIDPNLVFVAPNFTRNIVNDQNNSYKISENLRLCFISRISKKKNLDYALNVLLQIRIPVTFDIYGPIEDKIYWDTCLNIISKLPTNIKVRYHGAVENAQVPSIIKNYDLLFFPTHGENFGHILYESLAAGTPLLISTNTPLKNLRAKNIGWDIDLKNPELFEDILNNFRNHTLDQIKLIRGCCIEYWKTHTNNTEVIEANKALFNSSKIS